MKFDLVTDIRDSGVENFCVLELGLARPPRDGIVLGFRRPGEENALEAGAFFERYTGVNGSVTGHWAVKQGRWIFPEMISTVFLYVFWDLGCSKMIGEVRASDKKTRRIDEKLGMREVATIPRYFPDDDLVIYEMLRQDCRYIPQEVRDGQTRCAERPE